MHRLDTSTLFLAEGCVNQVHLALHQWKNPQLRTIPPVTTSNDHLSRDRLGYIAVPAEQEQLSWSQTGLQPKPTKGKQGCVLKSRHGILSTHAQTRPLVSASSQVGRLSHSLFELLEGVRKSWWCLTRKFAKSALWPFKLHVRVNRQLCHWERKSKTAWLSKACKI